MDQYLQKKGYTIATETNPELALTARYIVYYQRGFTDLTPTAELLWKDLTWGKAYYEEADDVTAAITAVIEDGVSNVFVYEYSDILRQWQDVSSTYYSEAISQNSLTPNEPVFTQEEVDEYLIESGLEQLDA